MAKRPGALMLTFSKKNKDIKILLENKKIGNETFIVTDYICEAIRFYEKYKDNIKFNDLEDIRKLIDERLKKFMEINSTITLGSTKCEDIEEEKMIINEIRTNINSLESNLDDIPIDED